MVNLKDQRLGENVRKSFSRTRFNLELPDLVEIQTKSYKWFLEEGLTEVLHEVSPITDFSGNLLIEFISYTLDTSKPNYPVEECKERDVNYAAPLKVNVRLTNKQTGEVKQTDDRERYLRHQRCRARHRFPDHPFSRYVLRLRDRQDR